MRLLKTEHRLPYNTGNAENMICKEGKLQKGFNFWYL